MQQYRVVLISLLAHYGGSYLAKPYAVPPAGSGKDETAGYACCRQVCPVYDEGGAVKVRGREGAADFQLFADSERFLRSYDFQLPEASGSAAGNGDEVDDLPVVYAGAFQDEGG